MSRPDDAGGAPPPELKLAKDFPGLGPGGGGPTVDHTAVRDVLSRLRKNLSPVYGSPQPNMSATWSGPGTVAQTAGLGNVGPESTGKWEVANNFGGNVEFAYKAFIDSYSELVEYVEKWAGAVETAITNYEKGTRTAVRNMTAEVA